MLMRTPLLHVQGAITPVELYMFFKEIHHMWVHNLNEYAELNIYDVVRARACMHVRMCVLMRHS